MPEPRHRRDNTQRQGVPHSLPDQLLRHKQASLEKELWDTLPREFAIRMVDIRDVTEA